VTVLDASAVLAFLSDEPGADQVEQAMEHGAVCCAANWSEVAQKVVQAEGRWPLARGLLLSYELIVEPVLEADAEFAAYRWQAGEGLSLGDRLCLATGHRLDRDIMTADKAWGSDGRIIQIR